MTNKTDLQLKNQKTKQLKLQKKQGEILSRDGQAALDLILDDPSPATLIQSFPEQDLYYLMHKIGADDFVPVLSLASSDQWEYILDMDVWESDRIDLSAVTRSFDLLFEADPGRLLRWVITTKPDFFEF